MTIDAILVDVSPGETRVAFMDAGRLAELMVARGDHRDLTGNIYLGRVEKTLSGIQAAFVDIGLERSGFLAVADARPAGEAPDPKARDRITDHVTEGDAGEAPDPKARDRITDHVTEGGRGGGSSAQGTGAGKGRAPDHAAHAGGAHSRSDPRTSRRAGLAPNRGER